MTDGGATTSCGARDHSIIRSPFTPTQLQELEHQALIFKYMVSGVPIPPELIYSVKRSLDSSLVSSLFPPQAPHVGWGCFQVGFGRKADPEPGRCRRTDGKKWRCSKEAYPDSKYCERHMHRGRNRSRKPVEAQALTSSSVPNISSSSTASNPNPNPSSSLNKKLSINTPISSVSSSYPFSPSSSISPELYAYQDPSQKSCTHINPFLCSHSSSSSRPPGSSSFSIHDNVTTRHLFLDSGSCSQTDKDYSYNFHGIREGAVDERVFFPEASGSIRSFQDSCPGPLVTIDGSYNKTYPHHSQLQSFSDSIKQQQQQQQQQQHCFVLGTDFKSSAATERTVVKAENEDKTQKPLHHFFGEWPPKSTDSWLDLSSNSRIHSVSKRVPAGGHSLIVEVVDGKGLNLRCF
ncbi:Growth-regulating factor 5 [Citrus sinensis]|uniref:Growth-regulating factor 5 n=1 Tax=Citrus sinensis TaxID=2711 RepID=A0ACB8J9N6_CITSI|nr:Growth-regulating factor 5 [Citrus sinensis]